MSIWGKKKLNETEIIQGCLSGSRFMQEKLYKLYAPRMFAICLRYARDYSSAEDMLQEGFIRVFGNISKFRHEGSFEGWMKRIFINTGIEGYRRDLQVSHMVDVDLVQEDLWQPDELHSLHEKDLLRLIQSLSPGYRTVFNLYVVEGYSHQEIADMLSISVGTSKSQLARSRYLLQKMILQSQTRLPYEARQ